MCQETDSHFVKILSVEFDSGLGTENEHKKENSKIRTAKKRKKGPNCWKPHKHTNERTNRNIDTDITIKKKRKKSKMN